MAHNLPFVGLQYLEGAIERAEDGDTIVVPSELAAELARYAAERMRPGVRIVFEVEERALRSTRRVE